MAGEINWSVIDPSMPGKVASSFFQGQQEQRQNALQELAFKKAQQDMADDDAYRDAYRQSAGDLNALQKMLGQRGLYKQANELNKQQLEAEAKRATIDKDKSTVKKNDFEANKAKVEWLTKETASLMENPTYENAVASLQRGVQSGMITQEEAQQRLAELPNDPAEIKKRATQANSHLMTATERMTATAPKPQEFRLGDRVVFKDMNPNSPTYGQTISEDKIAVSPDANLQAGVTMRGQNLTDARGREANDLKRAEIAQGGKPPPGYRWKTDGSLEAIPGGPGDKLPESQQKQVVGVNNLSNAITEYLNELQNFGKLDAIRPDARATMGTKYNNMMLQAKEAYNLGVLNGPDFQILQSVVTDPRSMRGVITSKDALGKQATELDRIMRQIATVSSKPRQEVPASSPAAPVGGPKRISGDADYNALPSGAEFVGPDGKTRRKP